MNEMVNLKEGIEGLIQKTNINELVNLKVGVKRSSQRLSFIVWGSCNSAVINVNKNNYSKFWRCFITQ